MITVLTWLWGQPESRCQYKAEHVNIWADMVRRNTKMPVRVACVTDMPEGIDPSVHIIAPPREFEEVRISTWAEGRPQCLRRISMFRPDAAEIFGERFACMDLDCVISGPLDRLLSVKDDFRICKGTAEGRPYNGSFILMTAGSRPQVYERFTPEGAEEAGQKFLGSDQAWIAHVLPNEKTFGLSDGIMMAIGSRPPDGVVTFYPGHQKPWDIVGHDTDQFVVKHYRADKKKRAVYLGYGPTVWADASEALAKPYEEVIACPEVASHWPHPVRIVRDDRQAIRIADMLGYELAVCGASEVLG